ncbi:phosphate regulon sensor histidine kinase PhoR [Microbulbifer sp. SAOS-129_SWC]|uniref:phosphate regulon sensor histidine kinase PhoR n=1 Tax=Microbulbifer sp. SAOS-129_SWC TaxID=3145235 RepID=UPI003217EEF0
MLDRSIGEFSRFVIIALGCTIFGFVTDRWQLTLILGLGVYLVWVFLQQTRFDRWLSNGRRGPAPTNFGIWGDISDDFYRIQRRHRREKQKLHAMLRRVQDSTSALREGIVALEDDGNLAWWNPAAGELLGLRSDDVGQPLVNFVRDPGFVRYMHSQGSKSEPLTMRAPYSDARILQLEVTRFGRDEALVIVRDITRLHNLEQMRRDFVANVSHELRTPLTVIAGYLETLEASGQAPPGWAKPLTQMHEQAERMTTLVNDLLLLSRLETSERDSGRDKIAVRELVERLVREARALSGGRHEFSVECEQDSALIGDATELHSAFANLVLNAVKYSPAGGAVQLRWWVDGRGGHFAVKDSGIGIDPIHIPRLTERFYRVDAGRSRESGGTGLGLAIVKHVLLRHGAEMTVDSTPGRGSTFTLHFPPRKLVSETAA